jgi:hypothetical protein
MTGVRMRFGILWLTTGGLSHTTHTFFPDIFLFSHSATVSNIIRLYSYDAHVNIECVMSLAAAKYITKYTHKGPDRATIEIQQRNEVFKFRDSRYTAASEAA